jgi:hypothetical protein
MNCDPVQRTRDNEIRAGAVADMRDISTSNATNFDEIPNCTDRRNVAETGNVWN